MEKYRENPHDFLVSCLNHPEILPEISGLKKLFEAVEENTLGVDWDDEDA